MVISATVSIKGEIDPQKLIGANGKILKKLNTSLSLRIGNEIAKESALRGHGGVTGNLSRRSNWHVRTRKVTENKYRTTITNPEAEYAAYINNPHGPYPFKVDTNLLYGWVERNIGEVSPMSLRKIKTSIETRGHESKRGERFVNVGVSKAVRRLRDDIRSQTRNEVSKIIK